MKLFEKNNIRVDVRYWLTNVVFVLTELFGMWKKIVDKVFKNYARTCGLRI